MCPCCACCAPGHQGQRRPDPGAPPVLPLPDAARPQVHPQRKGGRGIGWAGGWAGRRSHEGQWPAGRAQRGCCGGRQQRAWEAAGSPAACFKPPKLPPLLPCLAPSPVLPLRCPRLCRCSTGTSSPRTSWPTQTASSRSATLGWRALPLTTCRRWVGVGAGCAAAVAGWHAGGWVCWAGWRAAATGQRDARADVAARINTQPPPLLPLPLPADGVLDRLRGDALVPRPRALRLLLC